MQYLWSDEFKRLDSLFCRSPSPLLLYIDSRVFGAVLKDFAKVDGYCYQNVNVNFTYPPETLFEKDVLY